MNVAGSAVCETLRFQTTLGGADVQVTRLDVRNWRVWPAGPGAAAWKPRVRPVPHSTSHPSEPMMSLSPFMG